MVEDQPSRVSVGYQLDTEPRLTLLLEEPRNLELRWRIAPEHLPEGALVGVVGIEVDDEGSVEAQVALDPGKPAD